MLDSYNIKDLNTRWLRAQIGYVEKEPELFPGTIAENIAYGLDVSFAPELAVLESAESLSEAVQRATNTLRDRVIEAAIQADAHDFITSLSEGYETDVRTIPGGQKQLIAIACALLKRPALLLLDGVTSALDAAGERLVQESINTLLQARSQTTIITTHCMSTIRTADKIAVVNQGVIAEEGAHDSLMAKNGLYADLVKLQLVADATEAEDESAEETKSHAYKSPDFSRSITRSDHGATADTDTHDIEAGPSPSPQHYQNEPEASPYKHNKECEADPTTAPTVDTDKAIRAQVMGRIWCMVYEHTAWFLVAIIGSIM